MIAAPDDFCEADPGYGQIFSLFRSHSWTLIVARGVLATSVHTPFTI